MIASRLQAAVTAFSAENQVSMSGIVVFGTGQIAEVADFYFSCDSELRVAAFTADGAYVREDKFLGRPVVPLSSSAKRFRLSASASSSR